MENLWKQSCLERWKTYPQPTYIQVKDCVCPPHPAQNAENFHLNLSFRNTNCVCFNISGKIFRYLRKRIPFQKLMIPSQSSLISRIPRSLTSKLAPQISFTHRPSRSDTSGDLEPLDIADWRTRSDRASLMNSLLGSTARRNRNIIIKIYQFWEHNLCYLALYIPPGLHQM